MQLSCRVAARCELTLVSTLLPKKDPFWHPKVEVALCDSFRLVLLLMNHMFDYSTKVGYDELQISTVNSNNGECCIILDGSLLFVTLLNCIWEESILVEHTTWLWIRFEWESCRTSKCNTALTDLHKETKWPM